MSDTYEQRPPHQLLVPPGGAQLHARDMTATFAADLTLAQTQSKLAQLNQWVPIDGDPALSLAQLVEQNSTGPLRLGYGAWRDLLLGVQFTNGGGELITAGGRTVKNVAGYDLTKFMVGQHGIFGRIVMITTRTYRRPDGALIARHSPDPARVATLIPTPLRPQWALLTPDALLCGYLGDDTTLAWYESNVKVTEPLEVNRRSLEEDVDHRMQLWSARRAGTSHFRASVPPARLRDFTSQLNGKSWVADPAFGIVVGELASPEQRANIRDAARSVNGSVQFRGRPEETDDDSVTTPEFSTNPAERRIIERLKRAFDPDNRLAPLPWHPEPETARP
jgi:FAD/FMN-containing dehydrogenase